jgi:hypothetical protein
MPSARRCLFCNACDIVDNLRISRLTLDCLHDVNHGITGVPI